jgi:hypothetical protein
MATRKQNKYAGYRCKISTPEELREAKWLIAQGDFKDMDDYIDSLTRAEIKYMKSLDAAKKVRKAA